MTLVIHNTLSGKKEEFVPLKPPKVGMYVCGITAYDTCHLGHARAAVVFDVIVCWLRHKNFDVTYVRNYTDVDDKIINRSNKEGLSCKEISERYIKEYESDMASLGLNPPNLTPKATEHIPEMIVTVEKLIKRNLAYVVNGSVYFSVRKFPCYGKLSGKNIEELESGARVEVDETKQDPLDFALWKASKPGEPKWVSPWGEGRPGWHIECSAMSSKYLGQPFDIHGGGRDLIFPHHENEIAQAEGAEGKDFVKYWIHNGFININAEKMSKSLGNITSIREVVKAYDYEAVKLFLLSNHYRSPIDYTQKAMTEASSSLDRFYDTLERLQKIGRMQSVSETPDPCDEAKELQNLLVNFDTRFSAAMDDDFNTAGAAGLMFEVVRAINRYLDAMGDKPTEFAGWVAVKLSEIQLVVAKVFGVFGSDVKTYRERAIMRATGARGVDPSKIEALISERKSARAAKNFARSDEIRNELHSMGVEIKDKPDGTTEWKLK